VEVTLNQALQKIPTHLTIGKGLAQSTAYCGFLGATADASLLTLAHAFDVTNTRTGQACKMAPAALPSTIPGQDQMVQIFLDASTMNCVVSTMFDNGILSLNESGITTTDWFLFIPQLQHLYPNRPMVLQLVPQVQPLVAVSAQGGVVTTANYSMILTVVLANGTEVQAATLDVAATFGLAVWVGPTEHPNATAAIYANVTALDIELTVTESNIGHISVDGLQKLIRSIEPTVVAMLDGFLAPGFPIPITKGVSLSNPDIFLGSGFFAIAADVKFAHFLI